MTHLPHDISDIPYFPRGPSAWEWGLFFIVFAFLYCYVASRRRRSAYRRERSPLALTRARLQEIITESSTTHSGQRTLSELSLLIRRAMEARWNFSAATFSLNELQNAEAARSGDFQSIYQLLLRIEKLKYEPQLLDDFTLHALLSESKRALEELPSE